MGCHDAVTNVDQLTQMEEIGGNYNLTQIRAFINGIQSAGEQLKQNANPRLVLEVLMLSIPGRKVGIR